MLLTIVLFKINCLSLFLNLFLCHKPFLLLLIYKQRVACAFKSIRTWNYWWWNINVCGFFIVLQEFLIKMIIFWWMGRSHSGFWDFFDQILSFFPILRRSSFDLGRWTPLLMFLSRHFSMKNVPHSMAKFLVKTNHFLRFVQRCRSKSPEIHSIFT